MDYDGDGFTDLSVKTDDGRWLIDFNKDLNSGNYSYGGWDWMGTGFGSADCIAVLSNYHNPLPNATNTLGKVYLSIKDNTTSNWMVYFEPLTLQNSNFNPTNLPYGCIYEPSTSNPCDKNKPFKSSIQMLLGYGTSDAIIPIPANHYNANYSDFGIVTKNDGRWLIDQYNLSPNKYDFVSLQGKLGGGLDAANINEDDLVNLKKIRDGYFNLLSGSMIGKDFNAKKYYLEALNQISQYNSNTNPSNLKLSTFYADGDNSWFVGLDDVNNFYKKSWSTDQTEKDKFTNFNSEIGNFYNSLSTDQKNRIFDIEIGDEPIPDNIEKQFFDITINTSGKYNGSIPFWTNYYSTLGYGLKDKPTFINLMPRYYSGFSNDNDYEKYLDDFAIASQPSPFIAFDHYPFRYTGDRFNPTTTGFFNSYFYNLRIVKNKFLDRTLIAFPHSATNEPGLINENYQQQQFLAFCPIAYGAKGLIYWPYDAGSIGGINYSTDKYNNVTKINKYINDIVGPIVIDNKYLTTKHVANTSLNTGYPFEPNELLTNYTGVIKSVTNSSNQNIEDVLIGVFSNAPQPATACINVTAGDYYLFVINKDTYGAGGLSNVTINLRGNYTTYNAFIYSSIDGYNDPANKSYYNNPNAIPIQVVTTLPATINSPVIYYDATTNTSRLIIPSLGQGEGRMLKLKALGDVFANNLTTPITGNLFLGIGENTTLTNATTGGIWASNNPAVVSVVSSGLVTATDAGTANITYILPASLGSCQATASVLVTVVLKQQKFLIGAKEPPKLIYNNPWVYNYDPNSKTAKDLANITTFTTSNLPDIVNSKNVADFEAEEKLENYKGIIKDVDKDDILVGIFSNATQPLSTDKCTNVTAGDYYLFVINKDTYSAGGLNNVKFTLRGDYRNNAWIYQSIDEYNGATPNANETIIQVVTTLPLSTTTPVVYYDAATNTSILMLPTLGQGEGRMIKLKAVADVISPNVLPITSLNNLTSICANSTLQLNNATNISALTVVWSSSNANIATVSNSGVVTAVATGTVNINYTITDANACSKVATYKITVNALPTLSPITGPTMICINQTGLTYSCTAQPAGGTGVWSTSNNSFVDINSSSGIAKTYSLSGNSILIYNYTDANGCTTQPTSINVQVNSTYPTVSAITSAKSSVCTNASITLSCSTIGGVWSSSKSCAVNINSNGVTGGVETATATGINNCTPATGTNKTSTISYTVTNNGCSKTVTKNISVLMLPQPGPITLCGNSTPLTSYEMWCSNFANNKVYNFCTPDLQYAPDDDPLIIDQSPPHGGGGVWSITDNNIASITSQSSGCNVGAYSNGTTQLSYKYTSPNGCDATIFIPITVNLQEMPQITGVSSFCVGTTNTYSASLSNPNIDISSYSWSPYSVHISITPQGQSGNPSVNLLGNTAGSTKIICSIINAQGCNTTGNKLLAINSKPAQPDILAVGANPYTNGNLCKNKTFSLSGSPIGGIWTITGGFILNSANNSNPASFTTNTSGPATIAYTITNNNGCMMSNIKSLPISACKKSIVYQHSNRLISQIMLYPNPAKDKVILKIDYLQGLAKIELFDALGKKVLQSICGLGDNIIDVSNLSKGLYFIKITDNNETIIKKIIKE